MEWSDYTNEVYRHDDGSNVTDKPLDFKQSSHDHDNHNDAKPETNGISLDSSFRTSKDILDTYRQDDLHLT